MDKFKQYFEIEITREIKSIEKRYYISDHPANPEFIASVVRQHWAIENKLHWVLDMVFGDNQSRIRKSLNCWLASPTNSLFLDINSS